MPSFDYVYVQAERGGEAELLERLKPVVTKLYGDHEARTKRGSGWVQLELIDGSVYEGKGPLWRDMLEHPELMPPDETGNARTLSAALGVDVVYVGAVTSVSGVRFARCRAGQVTRELIYTPEDPEHGGWSEDKGAAEAWERPRSANEPGPTVEEIGSKLGLPGLEASYLPGGYAFDLQATITGQRFKWTRPAKP